MIPSDDFQAAGARGFFGIQNILAGDRETVLRRIVAAIYQRIQRMNFAIDAAVGDFGVAPEKRAATFMRIGFRAVARILPASSGVIFSCAELLIEI